MAKHSTQTPSTAGKLHRDARRTTTTSQAVQKTILVVDDDLQIRESLRKVLRAEGYEVVLAGDGPEGLAKFAQAWMDLVLLDISLPGKGGWDVFERMTSMNPLVPIIIITGRDQQEEVARAAGVGALLPKPLNVTLLINKIAELLAEPAPVRLQRLVGPEEGVGRSTLPEQP